MGWIDMDTGYCAVTGTDVGGLPRTPISGVWSLTPSEALLLGLNLDNWCCHLSGRTGADADFRKLAVMLITGAQTLIGTDFGAPPILFHETGANTDFGALPLTLISGGGLLSPMLTFRKLALTFISGGNH